MHPARAMVSSGSLAALVIVSSLFLASAQPLTNEWKESNGVFTVSGGEASECPADKDFFPDKAIVTDAMFEISYHKTYKIVTNKGVTPNKKYVLYQRGCPKPTVADADASFAIPLRSVALSSSTYFPVMHYMGEKPAFRFYLSSSTYSGNACIHKQVEMGHTKLSPSSLVYDGTNYRVQTAWAVRPTGRTECANCSCEGATMKNDTEIHNCTGATNTPCACGRDDNIQADLDGLNIEATFTSSLSGAIKHPILISSTKENNFHSVGLWSTQYMAAFFNKELVVKKYTDESRQRWLDQSANVNVFPKPKVLVLEGWSKYVPMGWKVATCESTEAVTTVCKKPCPPQRWCDVVQNAGGDLINKDISALSGSEYTSGGVPAGVQGITDAALVTWAKEADIVVIKDASCYTPPDDEDCATWWKDKIETKLKGIKGVDSQKVFDNQRRMAPAEAGYSANMQFEWGEFEPDAVLKDFIKMVDPGYDHEMVFFRNLAEHGYGTKPCADLPDGDRKDKEIGCSGEMAKLIDKCTDHAKTADIVLGNLFDGYKLFGKDYFLKLDVTLPYTKDEFNADLKTKYKKAVARAAGTVPGNVEITSIHDAPGRRAGSIKVGTTIRSLDEAGLDTLSTTLGTGDALKNKINSELRAMGLKEATAISDPVKQTGFSGAARAPATWALTAAACAFALAFLA